MLIYILTYMLLNILTCMVFKLTFMFTYHIWLMSIFHYSIPFHFIEENWNKNGMEVEWKLQHHFGWCVLVYLDEVTSELSIKIVQGEGMWTSRGNKIWSDFLLLEIPC